ncbi:MAG TPA: hypothetical protein VHM16_05485, partial [Rubrobacteraceae bacterium]|nr:hypothetical protein [Rubrobacteraceae bacterium]
LGATSVSYRNGTLSVVGVTADATAPAFLRKATGGVVGGRTGRVSVRESELEPLALAEAALRALKGSVL